MYRTMIILMMVDHFGTRWRQHTDGLYFFSIIIITHLFSSKQKQKRKKFKFHLKTAKQKQNDFGYNQQMIIFNIWFFFVSISPETNKQKYVKRNETKEIFKLDAYQQFFFEQKKKQQEEEKKSSQNCHRQLFRHHYFFNIKYTL